MIDFGDLSAGDPASDLAVAWFHFKAPGRDDFIEQLNGHRLYPPGTCARAKSWAVNHSLLTAAWPPTDPLHRIGEHDIGQLWCEA